jgi:cell division protein FtsL
VSRFPLSKAILFQKTNPLKIMDISIFILIFIIFSIIMIVCFEIQNKVLRQENERLSRRCIYRDLQIDFLRTLLTNITQDINDQIEKGDYVLFIREFRSRLNSLARVVYARHVVFPQSPPPDAQPEG